MDTFLWKVWGMNNNEMELYKLNAEQAIILEQRAIICYEKSISYLKG